MGKAQPGRGRKKNEISLPTRAKVLTKTEQSRKKRDLGAFSDADKPRKGGTRENTEPNVTRETDASNKKQAESLEENTVPPTGSETEKLRRGVKRPSRRPERFSPSKHTSALENAGIKTPSKIELFCESSPAKKARADWPPDDAIRAKGRAQQMEAQRLCDDLDVAFINLGKDETGPSICDRIEQLRKKNAQRIRKRKLSEKEAEKNQSLSPPLDGIIEFPKSLDIDSPEDDGQQEFSFGCEEIGHGRDQHLRIPEVAEQGCGEQHPDSNATAIECETVNNSHAQEAISLKTSYLNGNNFQSEECRKQLEADNRELKDKLFHEQEQRQALESSISALKHEYSELQKERDDLLKQLEDKQSELANVSSQLPCKKTIKAKGSTKAQEAVKSLTEFGQQCQNFVKGFKLTLKAWDDA